MGKENKLAFMISCLLNEKNLTQKQLGEMLGKSESTVNKWVKGVAVPRMGTIQQLANIYGVSTDEMIYGKNDDESTTNNDLDKTILSLRITDSEKSFIMNYLKLPEREKIKYDQILKLVMEYQNEPIKED